MPFITDEQAVLEQLRRNALENPALAEDCKSIVESMPYVIRWHERTEPIRCECCGTLVVMLPEAEAAEKPWAYKPAIWEAERGRKHTLRRCTWIRDHQ